MPPSREKQPEPGLSVASLAAGCQLKPGGSAVGGPVRRRVALGAIAGGALAPAWVACTPMASEQDVARALRRPLAPPGGGRGQLMRELVRYATLAPSSHNTQCWTFRLQDQAIVIAPDLTRRCPAVDPDDHHLHVSLGCATENLVHAALAAGLQADVRFDPVGAGALTVALAATRARATPLFQAISERQCTRGDYDGTPISNEELRQLEQAGTGNGVRVLLLTERLAMEQVLEYVVAANTAQMNDPAFMQELKTWLRFGADEAELAGDGLFSGTSGSPVLPRWLASPLLGLFLTPKSENERYARQIRNASGIAVFVSAASDRAHWVEAGRCYERFALPGHGARPAQRLRESACRSRGGPPAVRCGARSGPSTAGSGRALRPRAGHAAVHASAGWGRACRNLRPGAADSLPQHSVWPRCSACRAAPASTASATDSSTDSSTEAVRATIPA